MESGWGARIERKLQEQYLAVQLEKNSGMSKEDTKKLIITNYLNTINLGNNTLGVKVAAKRYFLRVYCACIHHQESLQTQSHIRTRKQCGTQENRTPVYV